ncbi:MAG: hypothetical protein QM752_06675 [Gammaproteobacteria bacterium]
MIEESKHPKGDRSLKVEAAGRTSGRPTEIPLSDDVLRAIGVNVDITYDFFVNGMKNVPLDQFKAIVCDLSALRRLEDADSYAEQSQEGCSYYFEHLFFRYAIEHKRPDLVAHLLTFCEKEDILDFPYDSPNALEATIEHNQPTMFFELLNRLDLADMDKPCSNDDKETIGQSLNSILEQSKNRSYYDAALFIWQSNCLSVLPDSAGTVDSALSTSLDGVTSSPASGSSTSSSSSSSSSSSRNGRVGLESFGMFPDRKHTTQRSHSVRETFREDRSRSKSPVKKEPSDKDHIRSRSRSR